MEFEGLEDLSACMRPASGMHHTLAAHTFVCNITVGLQNACILAEEFLRTLAAGCLNDLGVVAWSVTGRA